MAWLSNEFGEMYQVEDPVYNTYAEELAATKAATAGATSNYYDASANNGEGGQVYVYSNGSTVTTNNIGQPTSATLPTSQYQGTGGATSSEFRPVEGSPTSTNVGGFQVGIETPTLIGQNNQISYDEYGQPNTLQVQPELSNFDKAMRAGTLALAAGPWLYAAGAGLAGAEAGGAGGLTSAEMMGGAGGAFTPAAGSGASFGIVPGGAYTAGGLTTADILASGGFTPVEGASFTVDPNAAYTLSPLAASTLTTSQLANLLKASASAAKGSSGGTSGINPSLLSSLGQLAQGQSGYGMEVPGIVRTNTNPFYNTPQVALQTPQKTEMSTLSDLLRQGKSSWQT